MSEIRINIIDDFQTISGEIHGSFGDILVASLTAEPETVEELEIATERFIKRESDWSVFRLFKKYEDFEPHDAGLLVIDLATKIIMVDSTYSSFSHEGCIGIKTDEDEDFGLPYRLADDWKFVFSMPEYEGIERERREKRLKNPSFEVRQILFGKSLFEFIIAEYLANKDSTDEDLFTEIHAKWLMSARDDLRGQTPRKILLEKQDFISFDLHSRSLQWSFTKVQPPALPKDSNVYKFAGFGTNEIVVYYDLFRYLLGKCFENEITQIEGLEQIANDWLNNPLADFSGRIPAKIIESERRRVNLTMSVHECLIDEDCEVCEMLAADFIDTPMFWGLDGSNMEYDRFEFSFEQNKDDWEEKQREMEEFNREFNKKNSQANDEFFEDHQQIF
ncbi:hypothetical protein BH10ACI1_BH10ACI1_11140 [soil metagenome]